MRKLTVLIGLTIMLSLWPLASTLSAQPDRCPGAPAPRLTVGGEARVAQSFSTVRDDIGGDPIRTVEASEGLFFDVLAGPYCYGVYNWWQVSVDGVTGWVAEGTGLLYWLNPVIDDFNRELGTGGAIDADLPTDADIMPQGIPAGQSMGIPVLPSTTTERDPDCIGAPPIRLEVGLPGRVAQSYSNIRAEIGSSTVLKTMYRFTGDTFVVLDGPVCAGPHYWWQVEHDGVTGWVTEGSGPDYWLVPALEG